MVTYSFENNATLINWLEQNQATPILDLTTIEGPLRRFLNNFNAYDFTLIDAFYKSFNYLSIGQGFITILGKGSNPYLSNIINFNLRARGRSLALQHDFIIIAYDAIGGFYCLNSQTNAHIRTGITYFDPFSLQMVYFSDSYRDFLNKIAHNKTTEIYQNIYWDNCEKELKALPLGQTFSFGNIWGNTSKIRLEDQMKVPTLAYFVFAQNWGIHEDLDAITQKHITALQEGKNNFKDHHKLDKLEHYIHSGQLTDLYKVNEPYLFWLNNTQYEDEIVNEIETSLQTGFLSAYIKDRPFNELELIIHYGDYTFSHIIKNKNCSLAYINKILQPDYKLKFCKATAYTETKGIVVLDNVSWELLRTKFGSKTIDELFESINENFDVFPIKK